MKNSNWDTALAKTIAARRKTPFSWGEFDCTVFADECVFAQTGDHPAAQFLGRYTSKFGALRRLREAGYESLEAYVSSHFEQCAPALAHRGDLVLLDPAIDEDGTGSLGIVTGAFVAAPGESGLRFVSRQSAVRAFRVR